MHRYPAKSWWDEVAKTVGKNEADVAFWGEIAHAWVGLGWNPTNVKGMLDCYRRRELPGARKGRAPPNEPAGFPGVRDFRAKLEAEEGNG